MLILLAKASSILPRQETTDVSDQVEEQNGDQVEVLPLEFEVSEEDAADGQDESSD